MDKIVMYGSKYCADTIAARNLFSQNGIQYTYIDITEDLSALKAFLRYRDTRPEYAAVKKAEGIGIPLVVLNGGERFLLDVNEKTMQEVRLAQ